MTNFKFFIAGDANPIGENDPFMSLPLPVDRGQGPAEGDRHVSMAEYFGAVETFLSENRLKRIVSSIYQKSGRKVSPESIDEIAVVLEKHGEFYHPARVAAISGDDVWEFVVNVAVSKAGLNCAPREFGLLKKLREEGRENFIPGVYEYGIVESPNGKRSFAIFSGEWFSGFHEFHIASKRKSDGGRIHVWDPDNPMLFLNEEQTRDLYRKIALVLAYYFDLESFEQIHPWSHAAGDFVLSLEGGDVRLKLVTVRGYKSLFDSEERDLAAVMEALLAFLADLSVKNRFDRLDGVGDLAWADGIAVPATIEGFFEGLRKNAENTSGFEDIPEYFGLYLASLEEQAIIDHFRDVVATYPPQAPETPFVRDKIAAHASLFHKSAGKFFLSMARNFGPNS